MIRRHYPSRVNFERLKYSAYIWEKYYSLNDDEEFLKEYEEFKQNNKGKRPNRKKCEKFMINGGITHDDVYFGKVKEFVRCCNEDCTTYNGRIITIGNYNSNVEKVVSVINNLRHWNDYVIFDGILYGIPLVFKSIHREDDCFGNIISIPGGSYICDRCNKVFGSIIKDIYQKIYSNIPYLMNKYATIINGY